MRVGAFSDAEKNRLLDAVTNRVDALKTPLWVQLHTGSPGAAGTANVSTETTRVEAIFGNAPSAGTITNTGSVTWSTINVTPASETITHISLWSASTGGSFKGADDLPASRVIQDGDELQIAVGALSISLSGTLP